MNYRHIYHAGNFADVVKHAVLSLVLAALRKKETPFFYLDTHAGAGRYNLNSELAEKSGEWRGGIGRLWGGPDDLPDLHDYVAAVRALNPNAALKHYPGSPRIARCFLRPSDRMVLVEQDPQEYELLRNEFAGDRQVTIVCEDGYLALKARLPPSEHRGVVLIDPPYEQEREWDVIIKGLKMATARWSSGIYLLWYPIKARVLVTRLHRRLIESGIRKILCAEFCVHADDMALRLNGGGLIIVRPPWLLDTVLQRLLPALLARLQPTPGGRAEVRWLVTE